MPNITIHVKPTFEKLGKAFGDVNIKGVLIDEINKMAFNVERYGKQLSPVDTGRLRGSIHISPASIGGLEAIIATGTEYAIYVHEGTKFMRARPFMERSIPFAERAMLGDMPGRIDEAFAKQFKKL